MAKLELETIPREKPEAMTAGKTGIGDVFRTKEYEGTGWYLRVYPTGYLQNSTTVSDAIRLNKPFVVNLLTGNVSIINPGIPVVMAGRAMLSVDA